MQSTGSVMNMITVLNLENLYQILYFDKNMYFIVRGNQVFGDTAARSKGPAIRRIKSVLLRNTGKKMSWVALQKEGFTVQNLKLDKGSKIQTLNI